MIGPPGCGKSTFAGRYPASWRVCLDEYRLAATDDMTDQSATPVAARIQELLLDARLSRSLPVLVDATNVFAHVRAGLLARARYWQRPVVGVLFDLPLKTVEDRNMSRDRVVPPHIVREYHRLLPTPGQLLNEGFATVYSASEFTGQGAV
ncbi:AAA family ATPase [Streptomyces sp. NPDC057496]|uniref:AAA family ATPase n=1 Tax=Streptomyces sp. NPDC057496 TaxID=3346149 RepID=UPI0036B64F4B